MNRSPFFFAVVALALPASALAHPSHGGDYAPPKTEAPPIEETVIPETYPEVVSALAEHLAASETALGALKIADLHRSCANITDLVAALPAKTSALSVDDQAAVATAATRLQEKVTNLVSSADRGDMEGAKAAMADVGADIEVLNGLVK